MLVPNYYSYLAECLGTAFYIFIILMTEGNIYAVCLGFLIILFVTKKISGGHINPIKTIILIMNNRLPRTEFIPYFISQLAGGLLGFELYKFV